MRRSSLLAATTAACVFAVVPSVAAAQPAPMAAPLIPRALLFGNPVKAGGQISPDGKWLSWTAPSDGVLNIWVAPVSYTAFREYQFEIRNRVAGRGREGSTPRSAPKAARAAGSLGSSARHASCRSVCERAERTIASSSAFGQAATKSAIQ